MTEDTVLDSVVVTMDHGMLVITQPCMPRHNSVLDVVNVNREQLPKFLKDVAVLVQELTVEIPEPKKASPRKRGRASSPLTPRSLSARAMSQSSAGARLTEYERCLTDPSLYPGDPLGGL